MNWALFAVMFYVLLAMQTGLSSLFGVHVEWFGGLDLAPRFVLILPVFIGLFGPARTAMVAFALTGFCLDLLSPLESWANQQGTTMMPQQLTLIGPYTLGYLVGGYLTLQLRGMVFRGNPLSLSFCVIVAGIAVHLIVVALLSLRGWYDPVVGFSASSAMLERGLSLIYTGLITIVIAWPLLKLKPFFGFQVSKTRGR